MCPVAGECAYGLRCLCPLCVCVRVFVSEREGEKHRGQSAPGQRRVGSGQD